MADPFDCTTACTWAQLILVMTWTGSATAGTAIVIKAHISRYFLISPSRRIGLDAWRDDLAAGAAPA
jgi:hypothetical protein